MAVVSIVNPRLFAIKSIVWTTVMGRWVQWVFLSLMLGCLHIKGILLVKVLKVMVDKMTAGFSLQERIRTGS